jgi:hypothetical protein
MKALTIHQPWASLIIMGIKTNETRSWPTHYRGPLLIHAGARPISQSVLRECRATMNLCFLHNLAPTQLPLGALLGTVDLVGCYPTLGHNPIGFAGGPNNEADSDCGDFSRGRYAWSLAYPMRFLPAIPAKGHQGLWEWTQTEVPITYSVGCNLLDPDVTAPLVETPTPEKRSSG